MGNYARKSLGISLITAFAAANLFGSALARASAPARDLSSIRNEISALEKDLLQAKESQGSAVSQLKKIKRLLALQKKEIEFSKKKVDELNGSMKDLATQKQALIENVEKQKVSLRSQLRELDRMTQTDVLDAFWVRGMDAATQKSYFLAKTLKRDLARVDQLKRDVQAALALEMRILEERNRLDYYIHDLSSQSALLSANEEVQKEILRTNRTSRLEALRRVKTLKDSEQEVEKMLANFKSDIADGPIEAGLVSLKGRLPQPVSGSILSGFGKTYNSKTNLLTFQKGITIGAQPSSEVAAVANGKVAFAGPLKNYGSIVILEHKGQYFTLYGQLGAIRVATGDQVNAGDVLGAASTEPTYFEIRNKNVAVNPTQWLYSAAVALNKR